MKTHNKGEWSEFYATCSILHDRLIEIADSELQPTGAAIKVLKLLMDSIAGQTVYDITDKNGTIAIIVNGKIIKNLKLNSLQIQKLLEGIISGSGRSFSIPVGDALFNELMLRSYKAHSYQKSDINTYSIMPNEHAPRTIGFSIKSQIGAMPTLLNASRATNFIFEIKNFHGNSDNINLISGSSKIKDRLKAIQEYEGSLVYYDNENTTFKQNMRLTDILLPEIIAYMLLDYYGGTGKCTLEFESEKVTNKLPFKTTELEVKSKIKSFLSNIALEMVPTEKWDGNELNGGCIFVKNDGKLVCFTLYDRDQFKDYLIKHTKFETPSSTRHEFGKIYQDEKIGKILFKLNLDIRMT